MYPIFSNSSIALVIVASASLGFAATAHAGAPSCRAPGLGELSSRIRDAKGKFDAVKDSALRGMMAETLVQLPTTTPADPSRPNLHVADNSAEIAAASTAHHAREQVYSSFMSRADRIDLIQAFRHGRATRTLRDMHQMIAQYDESLPRQQNLIAEVRDASVNAHAKVQQYLQAERIAQLDTSCYNQWAQYRHKQELERLTAASETSGIMCAMVSLPPVSLGSATPAVTEMSGGGNSGGSDVAPSSNNGCADAGVAVSANASNPTNVDIDAGAPSDRMDASAGDATLH